jgi:putative ABC transport system substrate-binding protein
MGPHESPVFEELKADMVAAGRLLGREILVLEVRRFDFEASFAALAEQGAQALVVSNFIFYFDGRENQIIELAGRYKIPTMYPTRAYPFWGGLMSYNTDVLTSFRQVVAGYVARILKGEKPGDLPVQLPTKFEFIINQKTAMSLGIVIPPMLLVFADQLIK